MPDDDRPAKTPKTKKIGDLPLETLQTMKSWGPYKEKADAFSTAKAEAEDAKTTFRDFLKEGLVKKRKVKPDDEIDFTLTTDGISVFQVLERTRGRTRSVDLSSDFS